jgi:hypothetical protein
MHLLDRSQAWPWLILSFLLLIARTAHFLVLNDEDRSGYVPDDGLYYLQLGRNFAEMGYWTFDSGVSRTTGFHLLHAYACALMYWLFPNIGPHGAESVQALISLVLTLIAYGLLATTLSRRFGNSGVFAIAAVATVGPLMSCVTSCVEWPYVVLFSAATLWCLDRERAQWAFCFAMLGSLSRSDFGVFAFACAAATSYYFLRQRSPKSHQRMLVGLAIAAGAGIGVALVFLHTHVVTGQWLQSSVRMKLLWGRSEPLAELLTLERHLGNIISSNPIAFALTTTLKRSPLAGFLGLLALAVACSAIAWRLPCVPHREPFGRHLLVVVSLLSTIGYLLLYSKSPEAVQLWYTSGFVVPSAALLAAMFEAIGRLRVYDLRSSNPRFRNLHAGPVAAGCAVAALMAVNARWAWRPVWHHQRTQLASALHLRGNFADGRLGAFNAGYLAYYSDRTVVNLDGLVNDDVYPYAATAKLECYVAKAGIRYIVDWDLMFSDAWFEQRGGYPDGRLTDALVARHSFAGVSGGAFDTLVVYEVNRRALEEHCGHSDSDTRRASAETGPRESR